MAHFFRFACLTLVFAGSAITTGCSRSGETAEQARVNEIKQAIAIECTTEQLRAAFDANEFNADEKYQGKIVEVTGVIREVGKDFSDLPYVDFKWEANRYKASVRASFPKSANSELAGLSKDQTVTLRGRCRGLITGTVLLEDCAVDLD